MTKTTNTDGDGDGGDSDRIQHQESSDVVEIIATAHQQDNTCEDDCQRQTVHQIRRRFRNLTDTILANRQSDASAAARPSYPTTQSILVQLCSPLAIKRLNYDYHRSRIHKKSFQPPSSVIPPRTWQRLSSAFPPSIQYIFKGESDWISGVLVANYPLIHERLMKFENPYKFQLVGKRRIERQPSIISRYRPPPPMLTIDQYAMGYSTVYKTISDTLERQKKFAERLQRRYFSEEALDRSLNFAGKVLVNGFKSAERGIGFIFNSMFGSRDH